MQTSLKYYAMNASMLTPSYMYYSFFAGPR